MALGFAGSKGGIKPQKKKKRGLEIADFKNFEDFFEKLASSQDIIDLSIFINDICNLKCKHCYVRQMPSKEDKLPTEDEWLEFIHQATSDGVRIISIVGREPLMTPEKTFYVLESIDKNIKKGIVSNFTLMTRQTASRICGMENIYVDVSIDGSQKEHDFLRGKGAFQKTVGGVKCLLGEGFSPNNLFVSSAISKNNIGTFTDFVNECVFLGLKRFSISPICSAWVDDPLIPTPDEYCALLEKVINEKKVGEDIEVIFKADYLSPEISEAVAKNFISVDDLREDDYGRLFVEYRNDSNKIYIDYMPIPVEFLYSIRINHKGQGTFCQSMIEKPEIGGDEISQISDGFQGFKNSLYGQKVRDYYRNFYEKFL